MLLVLDRLQSDGYFSEPTAMPAVGHAILDFLIPLKCSMIEIQKHLACGQEKKKKWCCINRQPNVYKTFENISKMRTNWDKKIS